MKDNVSPNVITVSDDLKTWVTQVTLFCEITLKIMKKNESQKREKRLLKTINPLRLLNFSEPHI